ncbi:MAG: hypothetical protein Q9201_005734 [Fulgogasparrea decipioides]
MRTNMDPLTPTTSTLSPAISHIAETAASLAESLQDQSVEGGDAKVPEDDMVLRKQRQRETVRWVLAAPNRLQSLLEQGRKEEATKDWEKVKGLLEKWQDVPGAIEVKEQCVKVMGEETSDAAG